MRSERYSRMRGNLEMTLASCALLRQRSGGSGGRRRGGWLAVLHAGVRWQGSAVQAGNSARCQATAGLPRIKRAMSDRLINRKHPVLPTPPAAPPHLSPMVSCRNLSLRRMVTMPIWKISGRLSARRSKSEGRRPSSYSSSTCEQDVLGAWRSRLGGERPGGERPGVYAHARRSLALAAGSRACAG